MDLYWFEQTIADVPAQDDWLGPRELQQLAGFRIPKRRDDWRLGRWTAKQALASFYDFIAAPSMLASVEIIPASSGAPEVFFSNVPAPVHISLSHRSSRAACCIGPAEGEMGCDVELAEPRSEVFIADYFAAEEQNFLAGSTGAERWRLTALFWSAKESVLKARREGLRGDPRSWCVRLPDVSNEPGAWQRLLTCGRERTFHGWWQYADGMARTVVSDPAPNPPISIDSAGEAPGRHRILPFRRERISPVPIPGLCDVTG